MSNYTSHWLQDSPTDSTPGCQPLLIQITITPHGHGGQAYWRRQDARLGADRFTVTQELELPQDGGASDAVQRFLAFRHAQSLHPASREVCVPDRSMCLFPTDLENYRTKTGDECLMDRAALLAECGDHDGALQALHACTHSDDEWYWHTMARRIYANRARASQGDAALSDWSQAVAHAMHILQQAPSLPRDRAPSYWFGSSYNSVSAMLALAAETGAEYALNIAGVPDAALSCVEVAQAASHMSSGLRELQVRALCQLDRHAEAFEIHRRFHLNVPGIAELPEYLDCVKTHKDSEMQAETQRIAQLRFEWLDGTPASSDDLRRLRQTFPHLPEPYVQWITSPHRHTLKVIDADQECAYPLLSVDESLEKHGEFITWLHLHDDGAPELAQEIAQIIQESGIDPTHMLPIVGAPWTPDCFLLRTDGPDAGAVYFWSHEEIGTFVPTVSSVDQLFAGLIAQAKAGHTFVL